MPVSQKVLYKIHFRNILVSMLILISGLFINFHLLNILFPLNYSIDWSQVIISEDGQVMHAFLTKNDKWRIKADLEEISPLIRKTILRKEDRYFYYHFGINPFAIGRAFFQNLYHNKRISGASTISMQLARLLYPAERTYKNKIVEMFRAIQLELMHSKDEILQLYLNLVPYGGNIEGIKSASLLYFKQKPELLSLSQVICLSIIPNDPSRLVLGKNNSLILQKRDEWLERLRKQELFPKETITDAFVEPLQAYRHEAPKLAPHLAYALKSRYREHTELYTHINLSFQAEIENMLQKYINRLIPQNITNGAVLVIDNNTHQIISYVGSADFNNWEHQGQVNGILAVRSPGSTLKPFLYGLAMDAGLISPKHMVADIPVSFHGYEPENYDGNYTGMVSIEDALAMSLNVPAVSILEEYGTQDFIEKLSLAGFSGIQRNKDQLGLSLILGGCGANLMELTKLFSMFATNGLFIEPSLIKQDTAVAETKLLSPAAAYIVSDMLTRLTRPDLPRKFENSLHLPKIAWKTGTSYGRRDAWSIGFNARYTIGVWVGTFPGWGIPDLNGADYAAPLLFDIFHAIDYSSQREWLKEPEQLDYRLVCSESGLPPNSFCDNIVMEAYIPGLSPAEKCQHLVKVITDPEGKISYCKNCKPEIGYKESYYKSIAPNVAAYYKEYNIPFQEIPAHNPSCSRIFYDNAPHIIAPLNGKEYILFREEKQKMQLKCLAEQDVRKVYWFMDDKFIKASNPDEGIFVIPEAGKIKISCSDDKGRSTSIEITVSYI